jgi:2-polyprenyl-6-methoxyphenol hydroxylase-like FAD-dependent oxidoreductase
LGDAAHPMCPNGGNGAAQGILDAEALAAALGEAEGDLVAALMRYEAARRPATAVVVLSNRQFGPERVLQVVEERIRGPEDNIAVVVTREELEDITRRYGRIAGFDVETLNQKSGQARKPEEVAA